jgi:hypothetical protein
MVTRSRHYALSSHCQNRPYVYSTAAFETWPGGPTFFCIANRPSLAAHLPLCFSFDDGLVTIESRWALLAAMVINTALKINNSEGSSPELCMHAHLVMFSVMEGVPHKQFWDMIPLIQEIKRCNKVFATVTTTAAKIV